MLESPLLVEKGVGSVFVKSLRPLELEQPMEQNNRKKRSSSLGVVVDTQIALRMDINGSDIDDAFSSFNDNSTKENSTFTSESSLRKHSSKLSIYCNDNTNDFRSQRMPGRSIGQLATSHSCMDGNFFRFGSRNTIRILHSLHLQGRTLSWIEVQRVSRTRYLLINIKWYENSNRRVEE